MMMMMVMMMMMMIIIIVINLWLLSLINSRLKRIAMIQRSSGELCAFFIGCLYFLWWYWLFQPLFIALQTSGGSDRKAKTPLSKSKTLLDLVIREMIMMIGQFSEKKIEQNKRKHQSSLVPHSTLRAKSKKWKGLGRGGITIIESNPFKLILTN